MLLKKHTDFKSSLARRATRCPLRLAPLVPRRRVHVRYYVSDDLPELMQRMISGTMLSGFLTASSMVASRLSRHAEATAFATEVCRAFNLSSKEELQDTLAALVLSECVYKKVEMPPDELTEKIREFLSEFPADLVHIDTVQLSLDDLPQNYLVAVGSKAVYVAFMGTKQARDIATDVAFFHEAVWSESSELAAGLSQVPTAHRGFLARSKAINIEQLYQMALDTNRHLVLCGHSLGGAVAKLCTLRLLRRLPEWPPPQLRCICFATPAVGNAVLAQLVEAAGWSSYFKSYALPEDQLMQMLRYTIQKAPAITTAAATAAAGAAVASGASNAAAATGAAADASVGSIARGGSSTGRDQQDPAAKALTTISQLLVLPFARESAKQQLRKELQAEESTTTSLDAAAIDAVDASAASLAANPSASAPMVAATAAEMAPLSAAPVPTAVGQHAQLPRSASAPSLLAHEQDTTPAAKQGRQVQQQQEGDGDHSGLPNNVNLLLELQRRWGLYQLQRMGKAAQESLSSATRVLAAFHPFGEHLFITSRGVMSPEMLTSPDAFQPTSEDAQAFMAANPGMFSFHRMVAYRTRCLALIRAVQESLMVQGLKLPAAPGSALKPIKLAPIVPSLQIAAASARLPLGPLPLGAGSVIPNQVQQQTRRVQTSPAAASGGYGMMAAASAAAAAAAASASGSGSNSKPAAGTAAARSSSGSSSSSWRGPLAFLPGGKAKEELVVLQVQVLGYNLHLAKYISLEVFEEEFLPVDVNNPAASAASGASDSSSKRRRPAASASTRTSSSSSSLGGGFARLPAVSYILQGFQQAGVALSRVADGGRPGWKPPPNFASELTLQVQLPKSVVVKLSERASLVGGGAGAPPTGAAADAGSGRARIAVAAGGAEAVRGVSGGSHTTPSSRAGSGYVPQGRPAAGTAGAAFEQEDQSGLVLLLRSDFEVAKIQVQLLPYKVGVIGSSKEAALLMQALLSGAVQLQPALAVAAEEAAAARAGGAGGKRGVEAGAREAVAGAAKLLSNTTGRWWSAGLKWAQQQQQQQKQLPGVPMKDDNKVLKRVAGEEAAAVGLPAAAAELEQLPAMEMCMVAPSRTAGPQQLQTPPVPPAAAATDLKEGAQLQPLWVEPWVPVSYAAQALEARDLVEACDHPLGSQQEQQQQEKQAVPPPRQQQEVLAMPRSRSEPVLQRLSSLKSAASSVPAMAAARAVQAVHAATTRVKQLQRPAATAAATTAVEGPASKRLRTGYNSFSTAPPAAEEPVATMQPQQQRVSSNIVPLTGVGNGSGRSSRVSRSPGAPMHGKRPAGFSNSSNASSSSSGSHVAVGNEIAGVRSSSVPPMPSAGLKRRGGMTMGPAGATTSRLKSNGVGGVQPRAAAASEALSEDMEVDLADAEEQLAIPAAAAGAGGFSPADTAMAPFPVEENQQQRPQAAAEAPPPPPPLTAESMWMPEGTPHDARGEQGFTQVASTVRSWVAQQVGAAALVLQKQQQQWQQQQQQQPPSYGNSQQPGAAGPGLLQRAFMGMGKGPAGGAAHSSTPPAGASPQKGLSAKSSSMGNSFWPSAVLYQTLPAHGPPSAKPRRAWLPTRRSSSSTSSSGSDLSLQQVLRLTSRQLLRNHASSWSLPEVATWGPAAARGALGVVWSSVNQRSWQPARDAWSAWKGGLAMGNRGHTAAAGGRVDGPGGPAAAASSGGEVGVCAPDGSVCVEGSRHVVLPRGSAPPKGLLGRWGMHAAAGASKSGSSSSSAAGAWDVLLVAVTWDGSFPGFIQEPALGPMVNAAQSAGVPILPVLLVEGPESVLGSSTNSSSGGWGSSWWLHHQQEQQQDRAHTGPEWFGGLGSSSGVGAGGLKGAKSSPAGEGLGLQGKNEAQEESRGEKGDRSGVGKEYEEAKVWRLEEAPKQVAEMLGVPVSRVCVVQVPVGAAAAVATGDPGCLSHVPGEQQWQLYEGLRQVREMVRLLLQEIYGKQVVPPQKANL